ncbi:MULTISPECIES: hypothetical protein [Gordonia]|uniref:hypothetical protein n=1 Tax=Gordonia TaxID=2053 RepID=UPI00072B7AAE|nr:MULTISPECIES: hypothetical protein [Gordonia]KSU57520.1 hypothetical protein AS181_14595 [Gordonia sp. SGD-V-85]MBR7193135.1 hypothetical protein [Gordonia sp. SCSIO 19800]MCT1352064.1 hypothetical protein [Gordonia sp. p3-SID1431]MDT0221413.1 hypothetical protein [Gordonia sp. AC31]UCZ88001.1 hypothetical protein LEL84_12785 [Gordonia sp. WA4-43]
MAVDATVPVVAVGLVGGFAVARYSGRRELGGVVLGAAGAWCTRRWASTKGPAVAGGLLAGYLAAFGGSHPLAKKIGAWPSVAAVTVAAAGATAVATR